MARLTRIAAHARQQLAGVRARSELVDHGFRTADRYREVLGARLAAAIAYYGFFAVFALGLVGYAALGFLVDRRAEVRRGVDNFLQENLPVLDSTQIAAGRGTAGALGLVGLLLTGTAWVAALRSSQRLIWQLPQQPGNPVLRRVLDLVALAALVVLLGGSLAVTAGIEQLLTGLPVPVVRAAGGLLVLAVNLVLGAALLAAVPRLRLSPGRLLPAAVAVAVGLLLLATLGQIYLDRVQQNPAYTVVATAAGVLVYLYLVHQLVLVAAAWAATSRRGRMRDLAHTRPPATDDTATG